MKAGPAEDMGYPSGARDVTQGKPCTLRAYRLASHSCHNLPSSFSSSKEQTGSRHTCVAVVCASRLCWLGGLSMHCVVSTLPCTSGKNDWNSSEQVSAPVTSPHTNSAQKNYRQSRRISQLKPMLHSIHWKLSSVSQPVAKTLPYLCVLSTRKPSTTIFYLTEELPAFPFLPLSFTLYGTEEACHQPLNKETIHDQEVIVISLKRGIHKSLNAAQWY